jgi:hypothetical protein
VGGVSGAGRRIRMAHAMILAPCARNDNGKLGIAPHIAIGICKMRFQAYIHFAALLRLWR